MPGGGSILGMIISYRDNMNKLRKRNATRRSRRFEDSFGSTLNSSAGKISSKPMDEVEKRKYQKIAQSINRRSRLRTMIISIAALAIFLAWLIWLFNSLDIETKTVSNSDIPSYIDSKPEEFKFYVSDGDYWFKDGDMELAIEKYKKAIKLYPDNYDANHKLAKASLNHCLMNELGCEETIVLLDKLVEKFPSKPQLYELRATYLVSKGETEKAAMDFDTYETLIRNIE